MHYNENVYTMSTRGCIAGAPTSLGQSNLLIILVPGTGIEPVRSFLRGILSPVILGLTFCFN